MRICKKKKGFTLVELVVVIAVIAILSAVAVGAYFGITASANHSKVTSELKELYTAIRTEITLKCKKGDTTFEYTSSGFVYDHYFSRDIELLVHESIDNDNYEVKDATTSSNIEVSNSDKNKVYFFTIKNGNAFETKYLGYVSKGLDASYIKYINVISGEFVDTPSNEFSYVNFENSNLIYTVTFNDSGTIRSVEVTAGEKVQEPPRNAYGESTREFLYWVDEEENVFDFINTRIYRDYNLTAKYQYFYYKVTFIDDFNEENNNREFIVGRWCEYSVLFDQLEIKHTNEMTFESWTYSDGSAVNPNDVISGDIELYAKYHTKRVIFDIGENRTLLLNGNTKNIDFVEVTYSDEKMFYPNNYSVKSEGGEIFSCWERPDGSGMMLMENIVCNFEGDYILRPKMLKFELDPNNSKTLVKYIDDDPIIYIQSEYTMKDKNVFKDFHNIKFFGYESTLNLVQGILEGHEEVEELYPCSYEGQNHNATDYNVKYLYNSNDIENIATNLKRVYTKGNTHSTYANYYWSDFCVRNTHKYDIVLINAVSLGTSSLQGLIFGARTVVMYECGSNVTALYDNSIYTDNLIYGLDYLVIPLTINYLHDTPFNHSRTPIYFEWTRKDFDAQNFRSSSYSNKNYTRGKIFYAGEWEYNENGEPTPLPGYEGI